jgi:hypothetical protein
MANLSRRSVLAQATRASLGASLGPTLGATPGATLGAVLGGSLAASVPAAAGANSGSETGFQVSYVAGGRDAAGRFMGGTEMRLLAAHMGKLFAGNGYWEDQPASEVSQGAQILVLDHPASAWAVDHDFDERLSNGRPRHLVVSALRGVEFRSAATGSALNHPVPILLASTFDLTGTRSVFARDAATGQWSNTAIAWSKPTKDFLPQIRCFGQHRDAVTGADLVFAGDSSGLFRGAFDPAIGSVRWDLTPELAFADLNIPAAPCIGDRLRTGAFAEANGVLHASVGQQIYQRRDGHTPSWRLLYTNTQQHVTETGLRGMTAVATSSGRAMLLAVAEGYQSRIVRVDPADGGETTDLDLDGFLNRAWGSKVSFVIAAYNDMAPVGDALLLGIEAFIPPRSPRPPGHTVLDVMHGLEAGGWYLVRDKAGQYRLCQIDADFPRLGHSLVSVRAILASPFPRDRAAYFAGYDANYTPIHDSAWIARAATSVALSE